MIQGINMPNKTQIIINRVSGECFTLKFISAGIWAITDESYRVEAFTTKELIEQCKTTSVYL